jgi:RNA polymerase sigma-70 factor (ECF subfamily)
VSSAPERRERFERVAGEVSEPLQRYLRRRAPAADAADALADTLLVVWRRLDDVPDDPLPGRLTKSRQNTLISLNA